MVTADSGVVQYWTIAALFALAWCLPVLGIAIRHYPRRDKRDPEFLFFLGYAAAWLIPSMGWPIATLLLMVAVPIALAAWGMRALFRHWRITDREKV